MLHSRITLKNYTAYLITFKTVFNILSNIGSF